MNRGARFTVLRAGVARDALSRQRRRQRSTHGHEGDKTEQIHANASPKERSRGTDDVRAHDAGANGRRGIRTPDILRVRQAL